MSDTNIKEARNAKKDIERYKKLNSTLSIAVLIMYSVVVVLAVKSTNSIGMGIISLTSATVIGSMLLGLIGSLNQRNIGYDQAFMSIGIFSFLALIFLMTVGDTRANRNLEDPLIKEEIEELVNANDVRVYDFIEYVELNSSEILANLELLNSVTYPIRLNESVRVSPKELNKIIVNPSIYRSYDKLEDMLSNNALVKLEEFVEKFMQENNIYIYYNGWKDNVPNPDSDYEKSLYEAVEDNNYKESNNYFVFSITPRIDTGERQ